VRPIDWYLTPLGWQERATVYLEAGGLGAESALELTGVSLIPETGAA
jgi:hypothetical protein